MKRKVFYAYTVDNSSDNIYNSCKSSIDFEFDIERIKGIEGYTADKIQVGGWE